MDEGQEIDVVKVHVWLFRGEDHPFRSVRLTVSSPFHLHTPLAAVRLIEAVDPERALVRAVVLPAVETVVLVHDAVHGGSLTAERRFLTTDGRANVTPCAKGPVLVGNNLQKCRRTL